MSAETDRRLVERPRRPVGAEDFAELVRLAPEASAHAQHGFAEALERHVALGTDVSAAAPWLLSRLATPPGDTSPSMPTWPAAAAAAAMAIVAAMTQAGPRRKMLDARWKKIWSVEAPDRSWDLPRDRAAVEDRARAVLLAPITALAEAPTQSGRLARFVEILCATEREEWAAADALAARVPDEEVGAIVWTLLRAADDVDLPVPLARGILGRIDALRPRFPAEERTRRLFEDRLRELAKKWNLRVSITLSPGALEAKLLRARPGNARDRLFAELRARIVRTPSVARELVAIEDFPIDGPRAELAELRLLGLVLEHDVDGIRTHFALIERLGLSPFADTLASIPARDRPALADTIALRLDSAHVHTRWWALRFFEEALTDDAIEAAPYAASLLRETIDTELLAHRQEPIATRARRVLSLALERTDHRADFVAAAKSVEGDLDPERKTAFRAQLRALFPDALTAIGKRTGAPPKRPAGEAALLDAIHAAPDDDDPRLVYADALLEVGDVRGELIVLQCERATRGKAPSPREQELLRMNGRAWAGALASYPSDLHYERGFLAHVLLRGRLPNDLAKLVAALARYPQLRRLDVEQDPRELLARATKALPSLAVVTFKKRRFDRNGAEWRESKT